MATDDVTKVVNIKVDFGDSLKKIADYQQGLDLCKQVQERLKKELDEGTISNREYTESVAALKVEQTQYTEKIRVLNKVIQNEIKEQNINEGSIKSLRASLSNLTKQYDELGQTARESTEGEELRAQINETTKKIKEAEYATQRYYRNVGNYPTEIVATLKDTYMATGSVKEAFNAGAVAVKTMGAQLLKLLANPIVAALAAIALVVKGVVDAIKSNEEQTMRLKEAFAAFSPVIDMVKNALTAVGNVIIKVAEGAVWLAEKLGLASEKSRELIALQKEQNQITKDERNMRIAQAETEQKVANLRSKVAEKDKYTFAQRKEMLQEAIALEDAQAKANVALEKRKLAVLEKEAARTANDAAMNEKLAAQKEAVIRADTEYLDKTRRLKAQVAEFTQQIDRNTSAVRNNGNAIQEAAKKEQDAIRQAQDALIAIIEDAATQRRAQINAQYTREIEDLKAKLKTEENLNAKARIAINKTIELKEQARQKELDALNKEELQKVAEREAEQIQKRIELTREGEEENYRLRAIALDKQRALDEQKARDEITDATQLATELKLIEDKFNADMDALDQEAMDRLADQTARQLQARIDSIKKGTDEYYEAARQQLAFEEQQEIDKINKEVADEEWKQAQILLIKQKYNEKENELNQQQLDEKKKVAEAERAIQESKFELAANIFGGLSGLAESFGEENKAMAKLSKVLALGEIAINTGKALAAGIANAQSVGFPANIAAIAVTVATVLANMASAIKMVKSAKFSHGGIVEGEKYSTGGSVKGKGSGTSDSIAASLSNGESVLTANATAMFSPLLSAINQMGGGVPIGVQSTGSQAMGEEMLARAFARGVAALPSPVVSVEEINKTNTRVQVLESLSSL